MTRYLYNKQVHPPAPFVHVTVARPGADGDRASLQDVPALIDTAADITVVPWNVVEQLHLVQLDLVPAVGFGGHVALVPTFLVEVTIRQLDSTYVIAVGDREEPHVLLGRDVLNNYRIVLDGPAGIVDVR